MGACSGVGGGSSALGSAERGQLRLDERAEDRGHGGYAGSGKPAARRESRFSKPDAPAGAPKRVGFPKPPQRGPQMKGEPDVMRPAPQPRRRSDALRELRRKLEDAAIARARAAQADAHLVTGGSQQAHGEFSLVRAT